ncbi:methyltransferase domain-containing protein [Aquabacterium sp. J223]|uniref:methyltransferase domain-containing protein n=1 Tax=Aquabacterium sp. J223 TaxID=2898431 RepID=UPI0021ADB825|nr:methyltransferase domain-containing protein [Aquabacterium sp. J223]UUX95686.1 methyltransferase domain-containing protein [Aquabacterium sp. J223]
MPAAMPSSSPREIDPLALRHILRRLQRAPGPPWLHDEVASRLAERLAVVRLRPAVVLDWGAALGASAGRLRQVYPAAAITAVESEAAAAPAAAPAASGPLRWLQRFRPAAPRPLAAAEVPAGAAQLVWSNMLLQRVADPPPLMAGWLRALAVDGFLMFSTLGPGTLDDLREVYRDAGWGPPMAEFVDMHDLGDMLVHAGFADPVMDQEVLTLHWADADAALAELRALGGNAHPARLAGLRTPRWRDRLRAALAARADAAGRIALRFEVVYGHAVKPPPRPAVAPSTAVSLDDMRAMVRRPRGGTQGSSGGAEGLG